MWKFEFSEQMTGIIAEALSNMPYRKSAPVIAEMQKQIEAQVKQQSLELKLQGNGSEQIIAPTP